MTSTFNLLTAGGARFDKSRFQTDMDLFAAKPVKPSRKGKEKAAAGSSSVLPASLDFFHDHSHAAPKPDMEGDQDDSSDEESDDEEEEDRPAPPEQKITLSGPDPLPKSLHANLPSLTTHETSPSSSRSGLPLLKALKASNIHALWGVQCAVGGCLLEGKDVMCIAPTGSGKTLSYLLPTLVRLRDPARDLKKKEEGKGVRALVLVPTHDLAVQIHGVLKAVTRGRSWRSIVLAKATEHAICESSPGAKFKSDKGKNAAGAAEESDEEDEELDDNDDDGDDAMSTGSTDEFADDTQPDPTPTSLGIDILIATPERLHHLLDQKLLSLSSTRHVILDEADRLLSVDFKPQVLPILSAAKHPQVQKCFLSATMPSGSEVLAKKWLREGGVRVVVGVKDSAVTTVAQSLLYTGSESGKLLALRNLISEGKLPYPSLIFVQSVQRAEELHNTLVLDGLRVESVHGNRTASQRDAAVAAFRKGEVFMLVVTEVLARGMDFRGVKVVINYDFPQTVQSYIHRIGRTGRAGRPGTAITFFSNEDSPHLRTIANVLTASGCHVPEYMMEMKKPSKNLKKFRAQVPVKRKEVGGGGRDVAKEMGKKRRDMVEASKRRKGREAVSAKKSRAEEKGE